MPGTSNGLTAEVRVYANLCESIASFDEDLDVTAALLSRDRIAQKLAEGQALDAASSERLRLADGRLRDAAPGLVTRFPWLFANDQPHTSWWWHLATPAQARSG
jgi:hypothetical protein